MTSDNNPDLYSDDEHHPLSRLNVIDTQVRLKSGGIYQAIVVASPLSGDHRSQCRLLRKIENYMNDIVWQLERDSKADERRMLDLRIYVSIHTDSAPEVFELLQRSKRWVESNGIALLIEKRTGSCVDYGWTH